MLNAFLFDLDNTLIDRDQAFRDCVAEEFPDPVVRAEILKLDHHGHGDRDALFHAWSKYSGAPMDQTILGRLLTGRLQPDEKLLMALRALSTTVKLGIITNGGNETQRQKIRAAGLEEVFPSDRIWVSSTVGAAKPDPEIFLLASHLLGVPPADCLFVGDHAANDIAGARAAGMRARLVTAPLTEESLTALISEEDR